MGGREGKAIITHTTTLLPSLIQVKRSTAAGGKKRKINAFPPSITSSFPIYKRRRRLVDLILLFLEV